MTNRKYRLTLEVEIICPVDKDKPELTITPKIISESLKRANYAVCDGNDMHKLTADMKILKAEFQACPHCGQPVLCTCSECGQDVLCCDT